MDSQGDRTENEKGQSKGVCVCVQGPALGIRATRAYQQALTPRVLNVKILYEFQISLFFLGTQSGSQLTVDS